MTAPDGHITPTARTNEPQTGSCTVSPDEKTRERLTPLGDGGARGPQIARVEPRHATNEVVIHFTQTHRCVGSPMVAAMLVTGGTVYLCAVCGRVV